MTRLHNRRPARGLWVYGEVRAVMALNDVDIDIEQGTFTAIMGPSGVG